MKLMIASVIISVAITQAAVSPPPQFNGDQSGIGSWFQTNAALSSTNGHSWCGYPYSDDQPLFAPSLALMGGATSGSAWNQQRREYCGREALVTNRATGAHMLLYIGDSFAQPRSDGAIDIVIDAFTTLYGSDPNGNHNLVMNPVDWHFTGNVNSAYTVDGANFQDDGSGNSTSSDETGNTGPGNNQVPTTLSTATRSTTTAASSTKYASPFHFGKTKLKNPTTVKKRRSHATIRAKSKVGFTEMKKILRTGRQQPHHEAGFDPCQPETSPDQQDRPNDRPDDNMEPINFRKSCPLLLTDASWRSLMRSVLIKQWSSAYPKFSFMCLSEEDL
ncbi:MAG: hypothetical protein Q9222_004541 [Ikaeria aurantiellina]